MKKCTDLEEQQYEEYLQEQLEKQYEEKEKKQWVMEIYR